MLIVNECKTIGAKLISIAENFTNIRKLAEYYPKPRNLFAVHVGNLAGDDLPAGAVVVLPGPVSAGKDKFTITVRGKGTIAIDTLFDALIRAGKKPVILAYVQSSLDKIYLNRETDYYVFDTLDEVNAKAAELILKDE